MSRLPTVPVDAVNVKREHLIPVDGMVAKVTSVDKTRPGRRAIYWQQVDAKPGQTPVTGVLPVREDGEVLCIRVSDWLDFLEREAVTR
ncbi:hypothetical protein [Nonomuraea turcica]|uniref:hypothetical protein n=1 Tax=Nonomuraea sp. G32 TaxID=3067274 RepID=UPI00273A8D40|nr:hypothetical protein [Nonomuraea sp. G32]MDP4501003.1 hypothetical protein [Nonomuraea sp. G32]